MNIKKIALLVLVFCAMAITANAQNFPMRGMYSTNDSNARYKYIVISGDRNDKNRELEFYDSTGKNVLFSTTAYFIQNSSDGNIPRYNFNGGPRHSSGFLRNLSIESFTLDMDSRRITYTRM